MTYRVVLQPEAKRDLREATEYIAEFAPQAAERWTRGFLEAVQSLATRPEQWPLAEEAPYVGVSLREWCYRTKSSVTRALFLIVDDEVRVLRIRRPGQALLRQEDLP
jgi:plasmid stabilization system protein ParE